MMVKRVKNYKVLAGLVLKGFVSGEEVWVFVPNSEKDDVTTAITAQLLAIHIRKQSDEGRVELKFNQNMDDPLRIEDGEVITRRLSQAEILEFTNSFSEAKSTLHFDTVWSQNHQGIEVSASA